MTTTYQSIGKNIRRKGVTAKVTGAPVFCADLALPGALTLKALRSDRAHAVIERIDTTRARAMDGVVAVFTADDIPGKNLMGIINKDQPLLAVGKVRSRADAVALVAAESEPAAVAALAAITVTYRDLPAVYDPEAAMAVDAPKIHDKGNILFTRTVKRGDAQRVLAEAERNGHSVIEKEYSTAPIEHNYLEPDAGAGFIDEDGTLVIHASTQNPHYDHKEVVRLLDLQDEQVRIIQAVTGGGFGSKLDLNVQGFIGLALYHLKRPVRYVFTREEAYRATGKRHPFVIRMKTAADSSGKILAMQVRAVCNTGAYGSYGIAVASRAAVHVTGPYAIAHVDITCSAVYTNTVFCGAMRGFGAPQAAFAHESQMDLHARELGMDPLEIRVVNGLRPGSVTATGQVLEKSVGFPACLEKIAPHYQDARERWLTEKTAWYLKRGIGVGGMWYGIGNTGVQNPSTARVEMDPNGRVTLFTGCADIGQGSSTVLSQIAAEVLGIAPRDIEMVVGDTKLTTNAGATSASRQTYISGNAVKDAAEKLAGVLLTEGVNRLKVPKGQLVFQEASIAVRSEPSRRVSFQWLARRIHERGGALSWQGYFDPETVPLDPDTGEGSPYATYAFACHLAFVEVDCLTGQVRVHKVVAAHDVGRAIHPENVVGQICGGVAMGMGFALMEAFTHGSTESMKDYHIPTCADMPEVVAIIVEESEPSGPFGAKGVGEPALIPTAPAIVNAVTQALGKRIYALPASLERVLAASIDAGHFGPGE